MLHNTFSRFAWILLVSLPVILLKGELALHETPDYIEVSRGDTPVLRYHKAEMPPPEGASPAYRRSGFIHPLRSPSGAVVTSIHAPDHIHHMGLWHAWVRTEFRGRNVDFWNLRKSQGTVRFVEMIDRAEAPDQVGFTVGQQQVALPHEDRPAEVVLAEELRISVGGDESANIVDYILTQTNVTDAPLEMPAYRYGGGLAFRGPQSWGKTNDAYITSEGLDRTKGHATRGRWCTMHGPTENGEATVVIMGHPSNHDAPQRMRIWEKGHVFFNYVPAQEHAWSIAPGESSTLQYRVMVFDGRPSNAEIENRWADFTDGL